MHFEGTVQIAAPRDRVWAFVIDPDQVGQCGGGSEHLRKRRRKASCLSAPSQHSHRRERVFLGDEAGQQRHHHAPVQPHQPTQRLEIPARPREVASLDASRGLRR